MPIKFAYKPGIKHNEVLGRDTPVLEVIMTEGTLSCSITIGCSDPKAREAKLRKIKQDPRARLAILGGKVVPIHVKIA